MTTYTVEFLIDNESHTIEVPADQFILSAAHDAGLDLPNSCNAGVCTTCAGKILAGTIDRGDSMGLSPDLQKQGYVLLCVSKPTSNLKIKTGCEDDVYELQFGQFQKS